MYEIEFMSPATSTRWCPTPEQVMILEELYRGGVRTPNAAQIQQITSHLSLYGNIQGKNVFYWFQNHKARDRQKLRQKLVLVHGHGANPLPLFDDPYPRPLLHSLRHPPRPPPPSYSAGSHHQYPPPAFTCSSSSTFPASMTWRQDAAPRRRNSYSPSKWKMETRDGLDAYSNGRRETQTHFSIVQAVNPTIIRDFNRDYDRHDHKVGSATRPLKTLQLFPIEEKTSIKQGISSTL